MSTAQFGAITGAGLALVWIVFGFGVFVLVGLAAVVGFVVGRVLDGSIDTRGLVAALRGRRSSS